MTTPMTTPDPTGTWHSPRCGGCGGASWTNQICDYCGVFTHAAPGKTYSTHNLENFAWQLTNFNDVRALNGKNPPSAGKPTKR